MRLKRVTRILLPALILCLLTGAARAQYVFWYVDRVIGEGMLRDVQWASDGTRFAAASTFYIYLYDSDMLPAGIVYESGAQKIAWQPGGSLLAVQTDIGLVIWDVPAQGDARRLREIPPARSPMAWSPDGKWLAFADDKAEIWLRNSATGAMHRIFRGHNRGHNSFFDAVWTITWSPDSTQIASSGFQTPLYIWDAASGETLSQVDDFYMPSASLIDWRGDTLDMFDLESPHSPRRSMIQNGVLLDAEPHVLNPPKAIASAIFTPDKSALLVWTDNHAVQLLDSERLKVKKTFYPAGKLYEDTAFITTAMLAWQPGGTTVIVGTTSALYRLNVDVASREITMNASIEDKFTGQVNAVAWSPDGRSVATGHGALDAAPDADDNRLRLWDMASGSMVWQGAPGYQPVRSIDWRPDGKMLATGHEYDRVQLRIWNARDGGLLAAASGLDGLGMGVNWLPDAQHIAISSGSSIMAYDVSGIDAATPDKPLTLPDAVTYYEATGFDVAPDGVTYVSRGFPGHETELAVWRSDKRDVPPVVLENTREIDYSETLALTIAFSPDGQWIAVSSGALSYDYELTGSRAPIAIYDAATGKQVHLLRGHSDGVTQLAWSPDSQSLASSSRDGTARIWNIATGNPFDGGVDTSEVLTSIAWSPDGKQIVAGSVRGVFYQVIMA